MDASPTQPSQANLCNVGMLAKMNTMIVIMSTKMAVQRECTVMALKATDVPIKPDPTQAVMTVISFSICHPIKKFSTKAYTASMPLRRPHALLTRPKHIPHRTSYLSNRTRRIRYKKTFKLVADWAHSIPDA